MKSIGRRIPVRVAYVGVVVSVYVFAVTMQARFGVESTALAQVVIGAIGVAIAGDTWRPSGMTATTATATATATASGKGGGSGDASGESA